MSALSRKASEFQISYMVIVIVRYQMSIKWALLKYFQCKSKIPNNSASL